MDELTIADQKYLSSKKAAKVTGYAKDYIGQLCREGRVEARLVGRNWYVLETSLMEHRFGPVNENEVSEAEPTQNSPREQEKQWISPTYTSEKPQELEIIKEKSDSEVLSSPVNTTQVSPLTDMQSAWQEWFEKEKNTTKNLPDASEMLLPVSEEEESPEVIEEPTPIRKEITETPEIEPITSPVAYVPESYESVSIIRKQESPMYRTNQDIVPIRRRELISAEKVSNTRFSEQNYRKSSHAMAKRPSNSRFLVQIIIFAVVGLFIAGTVLSITSSNKTDTGTGQPFLNFLNGVSTVEK